MGFTENQQNAIDVRDRTLLVSAAAGSGKTFTLTQRIIRSIIDDGQDLSRLLIVTFTKAAASELKAKIARAVSEAIAEDPQNIHLQNQLIKLGSSNISTIDSFFLVPVRQNFEKLGLPATIRMADDAELEPIKQKLMQQVLDEFFDNCGAYRDGELSSVGYADRYIQLLGIISDARSSQNLIPTLCDIYTKLLTSPNGIEQVKYHADRLHKNAGSDFFASKEGSILHDTLSELADNAYKTLSVWLDRLVGEGEASQKLLVLFEENKTACELLVSKLKACTYQEALSHFKSISFGTLPRGGKEPTSEIIENAKAARKSVMEAFGDIRKKYLYMSDAEMSDCLSVSAEISDILYAIIKSFDARYRSEKLSRGICEFSDMPIFMLKLLLDENGRPTEYAEQLSSSFDAVYIDEYQDVNEIQDRIFSIIGKDRRFMVGDIKQSIYGFREAEPSIFADYRRRFPMYEKGAALDIERGGSTIFMSENFRCDECVINFTNLVCSRIFSAFAQSIGYTKEDDLRFAKKKPSDDYVSPKAEINIIHTPALSDDNDNDDDASSDNASGLSDEAIVVANKIADLIRHSKNADGTPIRAGDIAVLVRSLSHAKPLLAALSQLNIKYSMSSKTELFETDEMKLLIALLECIDNPRYDMPLCHLLTAKTQSTQPFFSFEEIIIIRKTTENVSLYDALVSYSSGGEELSLARRCTEFISLMDNMRSAASKLSADRMIKSLAFDSHFSALSQSSAYTFLYDCVCKYVKSNWNSLHSFMIYFKNLMAKGAGGGEPDKSRSDAVTIMTIHHSKGLEFNVCFLFGFGKQFNLKNKYPVLFNKDFGITMKLPFSDHDSQSPIDRIKKRYTETPIRQIAMNDIKNRQIEEEARVFYVALTRARERLFISATLSRDFYDYQNKLRDLINPVSEIKKGRSYIHWILLSLSDQSNDVSYALNVFEKGENVLSCPFPSCDMVEMNDNVTSIDRELAELYNMPNDMSDDDKWLSMIPSKIAASKAKPDMLDNSVFIPVPTGKMFSETDEDLNLGGCDDKAQIRKRIELMRSQKTDFDSLLRAGETPTAAERGTAMHQFLQFCDYQSVDHSSVKQEIERLKDGRFISERTASILDANKLQSFFDSAVYDKIQNAKKIYREFHFRMFRPASDFTLNRDFKRLAADKSIFVQGSVDLVIEAKNGELIICDYKTDRISAQERSDRSLLIKNMKERHGDQLTQYSYAIEQIFGKKPDKIYLFLLSIGECLEI